MNMDIIFRRSPTAQPLVISINQKLQGIIVVCLAVSVLGFSNWFLNSPADIDIESASLASAQEEIQQLKSSLDSMKDMHAQVMRAKLAAQADVDALTQRVGQMQAHVIRLNALGTRITQIASIDSDEFSFDELPGVGGPVEEPKENPETVVSVNEFLSAVDELGLELAGKEEQLSYLEDFLVYQNLNRQVSVAGRPIKTGWVSSYYGYRNDPFTGKRAFHHGVDLAGKQNSEIVAVADGIVSWATKRWGYGNLVELDHGQGYVTRYGHCSKILVKNGDYVKKGQVVALMGSTGRSTGPHVHFEVLKDNKAVNPIKYLYASR